MIFFPAITLATILAWNGYSLFTGARALCRWLAGNEQPEMDRAMDIVLEPMTRLPARA